MKLFITVLLLSIALKANAFSAPLATPSSNDKASWNIDSMLNIMRVEGNSRRTWDFGDLTKDTVQTVLTSSGRPIGADVELWIGPNWTPFKMKVYSEDGQLRPVQTLVGTRNMAARVECRNTYAMEFPFNAACAYAKAPLSSVRKQIPESISPRYVEGGAVYMVPFDSEAEQVQVLLQTDARQLSAKVELLNGPNNVKQYVETFTNNGQLNSMYVLFNTPGGGNTVRIFNHNTVEFPLKAYVTAVKV